MSIQNKNSSPSIMMAQKIMRTLMAAGHAARMVGGAVRDQLLGRNVQDVDLATTALPLQVVNILEGAGFRVVLTGLAHGTVTAVQDGIGTEITTLREDIKTDGRHAEVQFTGDWQKDAARRDFTINAMSQDVDGNIYDYFDGRADLAAGIVRFVGDADMRLREDYLRLLRYFRFSAYFSKCAADDRTLQALIDAVPYITHLSRERVWKELKLLLAAPDPTQSLTMMQKIGVLKVILPECDDVGMLKNMLAHEDKLGVLKHASLRRLAALFYGKKMNAGALQQRFAMSGEAVKILTLFAHNPLLQNQVEIAPQGGQDKAFILRKALYGYPVELMRSFIVLAAALDPLFMPEFFCDDKAADTPDLYWDSARRMLENNQLKTFPLTGQDVMALGVAMGPEIGRLLQMTQDWWIEQSFLPDKEKCLAYASTILAQNKTLS